MMFNPQLTFVGNLTNDPDLNFTTQGHSVCNFTLAHTPSVFNRQTEQWEDQDAVFLRCTAWRGLAENIAESLSKGDRMIVSGRVTCSVWEDDEGKTRRNNELQVDAGGVDLSWHTAAVKKMIRTKSGTGKATGARRSTAEPVEEEPEPVKRPASRGRKPVSSRR